MFAATFTGSDVARSPTTSGVHSARIVHDREKADLFTTSMSEWREKFDRLLRKASTDGHLREDVDHGVVVDAVMSMRMGLQILTVLTPNQTSSPVIGLTGAVRVTFVIGNGLGVSMACIVIGLVLLLFAVGFVVTSRHVTDAGALYASVGKGPGRAPRLLRRGESTRDRTIDELGR